MMVNPAFMKFLYLAAFPHLAFKWRFVYFLDVTARCGPHAGSWHAVAGTPR
jgi:hypothetical protein